MIDKQSAENDELVAAKNSLITTHKELLDASALLAKTTMESAEQLAKTTKESAEQLAKTTKESAEQLSGNLITAHKDIADASILLAKTTKESAEQLAKTTKESAEQLSKCNEISVRQLERLTVALIGVGIVQLIIAVIALIISLRLG